MKRFLFLLALASLMACKSTPSPESPRAEEAPAPEQDEAPREEPDEALPGCATTGCSGQICAEAGADIMTTCEFRAEYACYREAQCERQPSGECGFTPTPELAACLASPPQH